MTKKEIVKMLESAGNDVIHLTEFRTINIEEDIIDNTIEISLKGDHLLLHKTKITVENTTIERALSIAYSSFLADLLRNSIVDLYEKAPKFQLSSPAKNDIAEFIGKTSKDYLDSKIDL